MKVKFGVLKQTERLHLRAKFHLKVFIVSASSGQKPQFWANIDFWGLLYRPPIPIKVKFGELKQTERLHLHAEFHLKVFIVSASSGQKPQFWANVYFWGAPPVLYRPPITDEGNIWCAKADQTSNFI